MSRYASMVTFFKPCVVLVGADWVHGYINYVTKALPPSMARHPGPGATASDQDTDSASDLNKRLDKAPLCPT